MPTPFRPAFDLLCRYAEYHRDQRNIQTHLVGVPMVVFALGLLLSRPAFDVAGVTLTPAWVVFALAAGWTLTRGMPGIGLATVAGTGALVALAHQLPPAGAAVWLTAGAGFLVAGAVIQFVGHYYEGRRPAYADDLGGLLVGPMFVTLHWAALAGGFKGLMARIEAHAGPTHLRDLAHPVA
jgi:uncharacterized membrane protein YGL010W